ncbi:MAG: murein biosynthesis integral membrane protein MurJ, partial [Bacillota bacterium]|nr:murein biosynthesis integral membrane protein MurJ [Bacillota bacterium]
RFGATSATDAYLVAGTIPMLFFATVNAALTTVFIPVFTGLAQREGRERAFRAADTVFTAVFLVGIGVAGLGCLLAPQLTALVAPGFRGGTLAEAVRLTRLMFPLVVFQGLTGVATGMLQALERFTAPALVGVAFNVVIIYSILVWGPRFGITAVAVGTVAAVAAQVLIQLPSLRRAGYRYRPRLDLADPAFQRMGVLLLPVLLGTAAGQLNALVDRILASGLPEGSISALNYGYRLMTLPGSVFGAAVVTVVYPAMARFLAARDAEGFREAYGTAVRMVGFILIPMAAGLIVLSRPAVRLAFERGAFDAAATQATAVAVAFYSLGILGLALSDLTARAFYSAQDTLTPMRVGLAAVAVNIVLNLILVRYLAHGGLALATAVAATLSAGLQVWFLRRRFGPLGGRRLASSLARSAGAAAAMAGAVWALYALLEKAWPGDGLLAQSGRLGTAVLAGAASYAGAAWLLRLEELRLALELARAALRRLGGRRDAEADAVRPEAG